MKPDTESTTIIRPDLWLVKHDQTQYWHLATELMQHIERIVQVSLMDRNQVTHLCELTPSYCFYPVETRAEFKDYIYDSSREHERIRDKIDLEIQGWAEWNVFYIHCHDVDQLLDTGDKGRVYHYGDTKTSFEDTPYDDQVEALMEHFRGNKYL